MTNRQLEKLGLLHYNGNRWRRYCDGREFIIRVDKTDTFDTIWNKIFDDIYNQGVKAGEESKAREVRKALNIIQMMTTRDEIQQRAINEFIERDAPTGSVIKMAPRTGKCRVALGILDRMGAKSVLIAYPRNDIKAGWQDERMNSGLAKDCSIEYTTYRSIGKYVNMCYDYVIFDEIHEMSDNQLDTSYHILKVFQVKGIGLSGTMTTTTEKNILKRTGLEVSYDFPIESAVRANILKDYEIFIHKVELDDYETVHVTKKGNAYTEKGWMEVVKFMNKKNVSAFWERQIGEIIMSSKAKIKKTRELIVNLMGKRAIVFCGLQKVADELGIPVYHSGDRDEELFQKFCKDDGISQLATIKMAQAGIKIVPINTAIFNYASGASEETAQKICRVLAWEWEGDNKAQIHIVSTNEKYERERLETALLFFDKSKIKYV